MRAIFQLFISLAIAIVLLFSIIYMISMQKSKVEVEKPIPLVEKKISSKELINHSSKLLECMDVNITKDTIECFEKKEVTPINSNINEVKEVGIISILLKQFLDTKLFIQVMFGLILLALVMQLILFMESFYKVDKRYQWLENNKYNISEMNTNNPPILGVVSTLFAFGSFAATSSTSGELMELFRENVFDAVTTTIYGGLVYTINSLLHIKISQKED